MKISKTVFIIRARPRKEPSETTKKKRVQTAERFVKMLLHLSKNKSPASFIEKCQIDANGYYISITATNGTIYREARQIFDLSYIPFWPSETKPADGFLQEIAEKKRLKRLLKREKGKRKTKARPQRPQTRQLTTEEAFFSKMFG